MDDHGGHDSEGAHGVHLPDPSVWPLVAGFAALLLGFALVWWVNDDNSDIAGPFLGMAVVALLLSGFGWAYQDGVMKRKAEEGTAHDARDARFTQVITFAIGEGRLDAARAHGGVVAALDSAVNVLRDMAGFQDLRVVVSPAAAGPSQVVVETTWAGREELASYGESRQSVLDLIAAHPDDVVPGSVQAFDMEVVRDTKDMAFRFSLASSAILFGALALGGLTLAFGLSVFQEEGTGATGDGGPVAFDGTLVAQSTTFRQTSITLPPDAEVTLTLDNRDAGIPHNIVFHVAGGDTPLEGCTAGCEAPGSGPPSAVRTAILPGPREDTFTFTTPAAGEYSYLCEVHPADMTGTLTIAEGAPIPGQAPPPPGGPAAEGEPTPAPEG